MIIKTLLLLLLIHDDDDDDDDSDDVADFPADFSVVFVVEQVQVTLSQLSRAINYRWWWWLSFFVHRFDSNVLFPVDHLRDYDPSVLARLSPQREFKIAQTTTTRTTTNFILNKRIENGTSRSPANVDKIYSGSSVPMICAPSETQWVKSEMLQTFPRIKFEGNLKKNFLRDLTSDL